MESGQPRPDRSPAVRIELRIRNVQQFAKDTGNQQEILKLVILSEERSDESKDPYRLMQTKTYYVYLLSSLSGTLYVGITSDLRKRMWQHKEHTFRGFTAKYDVDRLLYYETFDVAQHAIEREKQIKGWRRQKKIELITKENPKWVDLSGDWFDDVPREFAYLGPSK